MITTAAVMRVIEQSNGKITLDDPMENYLPYRWRPIHTEFQKVTIKMLLQHRAGFKKSCPNSCMDDASPCVWRNRLKNGPDWDTKKDTQGNVIQYQHKVGEYFYSNSSINIFGIMLAYMLDINKMKALEQSNEWANLSPGEFECKMRDYCISIYLNYINDFISDDTINAKCNVNGLSNYAYYYYLPPDNTKGVNLIENCIGAPAGGWALSMRELSKFMWKFKYSGQVVSKQTYNLTESSPLGWTSNGSIGTGKYYGHNGLLYYNNDTKESHTQVINLPNGMQVVMNVNSKTNDYSLKKNQIDPNKFDTIYNRCPLKEVLLNAYQFANCYFTNTLESLKMSDPYTIADEGLNVDKMAHFITTDPNTKVTPNTSCALTAAQKITLGPTFTIQNGSFFVAKNGCGYMPKNKTTVYPEVEDEYVQEYLDIYTPPLSPNILQQNVAPLTNLPLNITGNQIFKAYPNPAANKLILEYQLKADSKVSIQILNMMGRPLKSVIQNIRQKSGSYTQNIDISNLAPGNYIYMIDINGTKQQGKFMKL